MGDPNKLPAGLTPVTQNAPKLPAGLTPVDDTDPEKKNLTTTSDAPTSTPTTSAINSTDVAGQQLQGSNANGVLTGLENTTAKPAGYEDLPIDQSTFNKQLDNIRASRTKLNDLTTSQQNIAKDVSHIHNEQTQQLSDLINQYNAAPDKTKPVIKQQIDALKAQPFTGTTVTLPSLTAMVDPMAKLNVGAGDQSTQNIEFSPKTYNGADPNIPKVKTVGDAYDLIPDKNKQFQEHQTELAKTQAEYNAARNERLRQIGLDPKNGFFNGMQTAAQMNTRANLVNHFVQSGNDQQGIKEANEYLDDMSFMQQKASEDKVNNDSPLDIGQEYGAPKLNGMGVYNFYNSMIRPIASAIGLEAAGSLVGAPQAGNAYITYDAYNQAYGNTFLNTYQQLKEQNPNDDAGNYAKAKTMAQADARGSALVMAGGLGIMKMVEGVSQLRNFAGETFAKGLTDYGAENTAKTGLDQLFSTPLAADVVPKTLAQIATHAGIEGGAFAGLNVGKQAYLQSVAEKIGIDKPELLEGAGGMFAFPILMNGMMYAMGKAGDFVMGQKNPYDKWSNATKQDAIISTALTSTPEMVDQMLDKGVSNGIITDNHKAILKGQIDDVRTAVGMLPKDASPDEIKAAIPLQIQINKNQALFYGEGGGNVAVDRAETENEKLTTKLHEILGSPLSQDESERYWDLNKQLKENGKLEKPDRLEFDSLSKRRDAAYNKQRAATLKRINLNQEKLPLVGSEDDRISLSDGTKYVTKEGDNYVPHVKGKDKPIADGTTTVDSTAPVGEKVSGDTDKTGVVKQADSAGKAPDTQVGNVTLSEHGLDRLTADKKENGVNDDSNHLTEIGKQEARNKAAEIAADIKSGKRPDINTVFHGTVTRTVETAGIIAKELTNLLGHEVTTTEKPEFDTWNIGKSEGKADGSFDEKKWAYEDNGNATPPDGESWNSFAARAKQAWDFLKSHPNNDHAIASSKMERMLSSLNESNGDVAKAKEIYFDKLKAENDKQAADSQKGTGQVQSDGTTGKKEGDGTGGGLPPTGDKKETPPVNPDEPNVGSKKALNDKLRETLGLKPLELPKLESKSERLQAAKDLVDSGQVNPMDIIQELLDHKDDPQNAKISIRDESVLQYYDLQLRAQQRELNVQKLDLQEQLQKEPNNEDLKEQIARINLDLQNSYDLRAKRIDASQIGGKIWSGIGDTRQTEINSLDQVTNSINRINTAYDGKPPADVSKELDDLKQKYDLLTAKTDRLEADLKKEQAKREVDNAVKQAKKRQVSKDVLASKKDEAINNIKDKVGRLTAKLAEKSGGKLNFADENEDTTELLKSISSDVGTLLSVYAKQGVITLDEMVSKIHGDLKDFANISKENIRDIIAGKYNDKKTQPELTKQINAIRQEARAKSKIESLENGVSEAVKKNEKSAKSIELQKQLADAKKQAVNEYPNLSADELNKKADALQRQIDKGEFAKTPFVRNAFEKDANWLAANKAKNDVKVRLRQLETDALNGKKTRTMRAMDIAQQWSKRSLFLMSQAYQLKMASTTLSALVTKIPHEVLGAGFTKLLPAIGKNAPIEGGRVNLQSITDFYTEYFNPVKFYQGTRDIIDLQGKTGGETELEREMEHGEREGHIRGVDLLTTDPHRIIKDPLKRAANASAMTKMLGYYQDNGLNPNDHALLETAKSAAYLKAKSEIFMSSGETEETKAKQNGAIRAIKNDFSDIERKAIEQGDNASYGGAQIWKFLTPIVGVPTNILGVVSRSNPVSFTRNLGKAFLTNRDVANGIKSLSQNESDLIIRNLKQGAVGTAFYLMGAFAVGAKAGGLYTRFNSPKDNKNVNTLDVDGFDIPKNAQHSPQIQAYQVGATFAIVYNHYASQQKNGKPVNSSAMAVAMATAATLGNYADMEPIVSELGKLYDATKTPQGLDKFGKDLERRVGIDKAEKIMIATGLKDEPKPTHKKKH